MAPETPDLVGTVEAAEIIGCERSSLSRWVALGKLTPAIRVSDGPTSAQLFHRSDIEAFAASYRPRPKGAA